MPLERILHFLHEIGIVVHERPLPAATFVPGIFIEQGELVIDRAKLAYPGDLLHEAGHLAIIPPAERRTLSDNLQSSPAEEMAAIAWSYAAALHIGIDPAVVFHPHGYKGQSQSLLDGFTNGHGVGAPMLAWYGLTRERPDGTGAPAYPKMSAWLRSEAQSVAANRDRA